MVDRFTITAAEQDPWIDADPSGQYVLYSDYAALEAQLAEAKAENERLVKDLDRKHEAYCIAHDQATENGQRLSALEATPAPMVTEEMVERACLAYLSNKCDSEAGQHAVRSDDMRRALAAALTASEAKQ